MTELKKADFGLIPLMKYSTCILMFITHLIVNIKSVVYIFETGRFTDTLNKLHERRQAPIVKNKIHTILIFNWT